jgi:hypothetical protein
LLFHLLSLAILIEIILPTLSLPCNFRWIPCRDRRTQPTKNTTPTVTTPSAHLSIILAPTSFPPTRSKLDHTSNLTPNIANRQPRTKWTLKPLPRRSSPPPGACSTSRAEVSRPDPPLTCPSRGQRRHGHGRSAALLTIRRHVPFSVISLWLAWMFRLRMIWELNSLSPITRARVALTSMTLDFTSPFVTIDYHHILNLIIRSTHHITFNCTRLQHTPGLNPIIKTSISISISILQFHKMTPPRQTPLRTPILARPLPRLRRVPRPTRAGPVRPRSMMISVVWRVGRSISVSRRALALAHSHLFFAIRYK